MERLWGTSGLGDVALWGVTCGVTLSRQWHWGHQVSSPHVQAAPVPPTLQCWQVLMEMFLLKWGAAFVRLKSPGPGHSTLQMVPVAFSLCGTDVAVSGGDS